MIASREHKLNHSLGRVIVTHTATTHVFPQLLPIAKCMACNQRFRDYRITHLTQYRSFFVDTESGNAFVVALAAFWCFIVMSVFVLENPLESTFQ